MQQRRRTLERLLHVKKQLHQMEEAKLDTIQRQKSAVEADRRALFDILGDVDNNDPLILGLACRHLVRKDQLESELNAREQEQKALLLQRTAQKKMLERIVLETTRAIARADEKLELLEIGERAAVNARSSLP